MRSHRYLVSIFALLLILTQGLSPLHGIDHLLITDGETCGLCLLGQQSSNALINALNIKIDFYNFTEQPGSFFYRYQAADLNLYTSRDPPFLKRT